MFYGVLFKQKTAYEMRISDWSSDVCSSDLAQLVKQRRRVVGARQPGGDRGQYVLECRQFSALALHQRKAEQRQVAVIAEFLDALDEPAEIGGRHLPRRDQPPTIAVFVEGEIGPESRRAKPAADHLRRREARPWQSRRSRRPANGRASGR